ncbi:MAG: SMI1/KNR4 family protein [Lawsonibacter sp.]|nr:SMI1/KNR4 family protein [Lawsonibacter sp.]
MERDIFLSRLEKIREAVQAMGGEVYRWEVGPPAPMETVRRIEEEYQRKLPADFVAMATQVAGAVDLRWSIHKIEVKYPQFRDIFSGELEWNVDRYLEEKELAFYQFCQSTKERPQLRGKLQLHEVPNGDIHLFDLDAPREKKPIVYLNHDGEYYYPVQLAENFSDYVESLLQIGLVGSEIWQLKKFIQPEPVEEDEMPPGPSAIDPACPYALAWRKVMGLA